MYLAHLAGIRVFVTGGIGGVHRGAEQTMDISADIMELGRTPVAVVCAGVKSILDIPKTLEALETQGVSVVSVGTKKFPAFFTPDSGSLSPFWVDTPEQGAKVIMGNKLLNLQSGMLFAVPIPEREAANAAHITKAIDQALKEADEQKVTGKDSTPFLLKRVNELSGGESLQSSTCSSISRFFTFVLLQSAWNSLLSHFLSLFFRHCARQEQRQVWSQARPRIRQARQLSARTLRLQSQT
jgi:pseudouridine-5'-phosphate glycosidase